MVGVVIFVFALGTYMVVVSEFGASPDPIRATWFLGGIATVAFSGGIWILLLVWHAFANWEVTVSTDDLRLRRWTEAIAGKPGTILRIRDITKAAFVVKGGGAKLLLEAGDDRRLLSIWFWAMRDAVALREAFEETGVPTEWSLPH